MRPWGGAGRGWGGGGGGGGGGGCGGGAAPPPAARAVIGALFAPAGIGVVDSRQHQLRGLRVEVADLPGCLAAGPAWQRRQFPQVVAVPQAQWPVAAGGEPAPGAPVRCPVGELIAVLTHGKPPVTQRDRDG
ncbi:hypothetical protein [Nocardia cyriacigeorgica]|uniref:hypothetical protein n=1 Tax=Nocardia cyriacigeorgica TaxID=135487 RepID=UPI0024541BBF|nr:hypothetical protein [Nocardia cyriacigeorgica]